MLCGKQEVQFRQLVPEDWPVVRQALPVLHVEDTCGIIAQRGGKLLGACVYDSWTTNSVQAHQLIVSPMIIRRGWFELIFALPFVHRKVERVYGLVPADNTKALKLNEKLGFTELVRLSEAYKPGVDYVIMEMRKENCRYI